MRATRDNLVVLQLTRLGEYRRVTTSAARRVSRSDAPTPPTGRLTPDVVRSGPTRGEPNRMRREPTSRARQRWFNNPILALMLVIGTAIVAGGASVIISHFGTHKYNASATLLIQPDPSLVGNSANLQADASDRYDQAQVVVLQKLVQSRLPSQRPNGRVAAVSITQLGVTDVLQINASARVADDAVASANQILDDYVTARRQTLNKNIKAAVSEVGRQLAAVTRALPSSGSGSNAKDRASVTALSAEYGRLVSLRDQIQLTASTAQSVTVLSRAHTDDVAMVSSGKRNAVLATVLGALVATAYVVVRRRLEENGR